MTPWLTLVIGVIIGLLVGWLIDLFWRRRQEGTQKADQAAAPSRAVEWTLPKPPPVADAAAAAQALDTRDAEIPAAPDAEDELAAEIMEPVEPETTALDMPEAATRVTSPVEADLPESAALASLAAVADETAPEERDQIDWAELSERVAEVADAPAEAPAHIGSELPESIEGLPAGAAEVLAPPGGGTATGPKSDNLLIVEGIGRVYDGKLRAAGINTFAGLVNAGEARLQEIIQPQAWQRVNFAEWIEQAQLIVEGKEEELRVLQDRLFKRKKG